MTTPPFASRAAPADVRNAALLTLDARNAAFLTSTAGGDDGVDPVCRAAAEDVAELLADLGHHVEPVTLTLSEEVVEAFLLLWAVLSRADPVASSDETALQPLTRYLRERGRGIDGVAALGALHTVQVGTRGMVAERAGLDAVLTPSVALPPRPVGWFTDGGDPAVDFARQIAFTPWTAVANLTGEPALGLPLGWPEVDGRVLPVGVTLRGRRGEEALLLALGAELEAARPWADRRPPTWAGTYDGTSDP